MWPFVPQRAHRINYLRVNVFSVRTNLPPPPVILKVYHIVRYVSWTKRLLWYWRHKKLQCIPGKLNLYGETHHVPGFLMSAQISKRKTNLSLRVCCSFKWADARCPQVQTKHHIRPLSQNVNKSLQRSCSTGGSRVQVSPVLTPLKRHLPALEADRRHQWTV